MYDAGPGQKVFVYLPPYRLLLTESLNSVRTYVRFVCEWDHRYATFAEALLRRLLGFRAWNANPKSSSVVKNPLCARRECSGIGGPALPLRPVKKARIDAVLAERGLFPSRTAAAGAVRAGEVRVGADGPVALRPSQLVEPEAELDRRRGPALRLARRDQARERARGARDRRRRARLPRRRRLDRRLHRLPAAARRRPGGRGRRRLRPDRPAPARGPAGDRDRAPQRPRAGARRPALRRPTLATIDVSFISLTKILPAVAACLAPGGEVLAMVKPQFELGRERVGRGVVRDAGDRREAILDGRPRAPRGSACRSAASPPPGCPGRRATARPSSGAAARVELESIGDLEAAIAAEVGADAMKTAALITHSHPPPATEAVRSPSPARARGRLAPGRRPAASSTSTARRPPGSSWSRRRRRRPTSASCSAATARSSTRCAASPAPKCRSSASTSARSASSPRSSATRPRRGSRRALAGEIETIDLPGARGRDRTASAASASTTSASAAGPTTGSPSSATGSPARRSATCAATGSSPPPRSARPATTSPTRARSSPGA